MNVMLADWDLRPLHILFYCDLFVWCVCICMHMYMQWNNNKNSLSSSILRRNKWKILSSLKTSLSCLGAGGSHVTCFRVIQQLFEHLRHWRGHQRLPLLWSWKKSQQTSETRSQHAHTQAAEDIRSCHGRTIKVLTDVEWLTFMFKLDLAVFIDDY